MITLPSEHTPLTPQEVLSYLWGHKDGIWLPNNLFFPTGKSFIQLFDTGKSVATDIFEIVIDEGSNKPDNVRWSPLLGVSTGLVVKKDISCGGYVAANQGLIALGSGMYSQWDPPGIWLLHTNIPSIHDITQGSSLPSTGVDGQYFINTSNGNIYRRENGVWLSKGPVSECTYNFDTCYIRKSGYDNPEPPFAQPNRPIPEASLGHLKCADITAHHINPPDDNRPPRDLVPVFKVNYAAN
jgi:hypothetical protein